MEVRRAPFRRTVAGGTTWLGWSEGGVTASPRGKGEASCYGDGLDQGGAKMSAESTLSDSVPVQGMGSHALGGGRWHVALGGGPERDWNVQNEVPYVHPSVLT